MYSHDFKPGSFKLIQIDTVELHNFHNTTGEGFLHSHNFWEIGFVLDGKGIYGHDGKEHEISGGDLIITAPLDIHFECGLNTGGVEIFFLLFDSKFSPCSSFHLPFSNSCAVNMKSVPVIQQIFRSILIEALERKSGHEYIIEAELIKLFIFLSRNDSEKCEISVYPESFNEFLGIRKLKLIAEIKKYMEVNISSNLNISDIASKFYISSQHLARIFKEATDITPKEYQKLLRINIAKQMLTGTSDEIRTISEKLGYTDIHYFYRAFKQATSMTPVQYRKSKDFLFCHSGSKPTLDN